jgi:hypothetical protein
VVDDSRIERLQVAEQMTWVDWITICAAIFFFVTLLVLRDKRNGKW